MSLGQSSTCNDPCGCRQTHDKRPTESDPEQPLDGTRAVQTLARYNGRSMSRTERESVREETTTWRAGHGEFALCDEIQVLP
jgi:hypothetical protein